jgi:hypothetical protein
MTLRLRVSALVVLAELAAAAALVAAPAPASAQFFDFFGGGGRGGYRQPSFPFFDQPRSRPRAAPAPSQQVDSSRAPPPPKADKASPPELKTVVVMGDSMADWLAYGLEQAFAETPDIAVARKQRNFSSLIYNPGRHDPRTSVDWPVAARDILANQPANFVVMMIGLSDRESIRVPAPPRPAVKLPTKPGQPDASKPAQPDGGQTTDQAKPAETPNAPDAAAADPGTAAPTAAATYEFKTEKWAELYGKRIDDTIAALKSKGVPVFWVGLPPILGTRSTSEMQYLNEQFRSHAEKAGITFIDVWDGFADDAGRFTMQGPDYEGQTRRLRTPDGVYFTPAGARKLAHYVEREIQRALTPTGPIAIALPQEPLLQTPTAAQPEGPGGTPRPLAGPVVPLNANVDASKSDALLGAATPRQTIADAVATRVLVRGEPMPAPAGRADDFAWPRRAPAPLGADPVVATATLPMTPMVVGGGSPQKTAGATQGPAAPPARTAQAPVRPRPRVSQYQQYGYGYRQQNPFFFFFGR